MVFWGSLSDPEETAQDDEVKHITREDAVQAELWFLPLLSLFPSHFTWKQFTKLLSLSTRRGGVDEPFAWESIKNLRKLCMGKDITFKVDYTVPSIGREFGYVFLGDKSVALMVVSDGWVKVREQGQQKGDASLFLAELLRLEEQAKQQGLGRLANANGLKLGFYHKTCQSIEAIVKETTARFFSRASTLAAPLIRMHFHDCFVRNDLRTEVLGICADCRGGYDID
ncbi:Ribonuclease TUDOR 1 [Camellia lanceoleosa]|uniref:Ribonuclease TUDOR 1 n=1 Tax=Camellia lanceoleosa TaxID=1840588 RepID=A0ACC0HRJ9_9ERIC|nr:Ribonuclease TUDOR 1 [Camellia lanceoleosa]